MSGEAKKQSLENTGTRKTAIENATTFSKSIKTSSAAETENEDNDDVDMDKATSELLNIDVGANGKILDGNIQRADSREAVLSTTDKESYENNIEELAKKKSFGSRLFSPKHPLSELVLVNSTLHQALLFDSTSPMTKKSLNTVKSTDTPYKLADTRAKSPDVTAKFFDTSDIKTKLSDTFAKLSDTTTAKLSDEATTPGSKKANLAPVYDRNTSFAGKPSAHARSYSHSESTLLIEMFRNNKIHLPEKVRSRTKFENHWKKSHIAGHGRKKHKKLKTSKVSRSIS